MKKAKNNLLEKGFTLLELLIVIAIIGLMAGVILVSFSGASKKARIAQGWQFSDTLRASLQGDMVAWWPFDETSGTTAKDNYFGQHHGTVYGAQWVKGIVNNASSFDGIDDYILIGNPVPAPLQIQNEITLEAWIYATQYPSSDLGLIVGSQNDSNGAGATIFLDGRTSPDGQPSPPGHIHFQIGDGAWHTTNANSQVPLNQWVHIAATRKANQDAQIYYNGKLQPLTSVPWGGAISYTNCWFQIGRQRDASGATHRYFKGVIDEVRIYSAVLSQSAIQQHYAQGLKTHQNLAIEK